MPKLSRSRDVEEDDVEKFVEESEVETDNRIRRSAELARKRKQMREKAVSKKKAVPQSEEEE